MTCQYAVMGGGAMGGYGFKYIYGPVESWRLGKSLGIDPLSDNSKICNLNCIYCQLGRTHNLTNVRKIYVPVHKIIREIEDLPSNLDIDHYTFSGRGEPTLASNLGVMIKELKQLKRNKVAVITNSTLMHLKNVRNDLYLADSVVAKLDACGESSFAKIDRAMSGITFKDMVWGIKRFNRTYRGKLAIQVMFVEENRKYAREIADIVTALNADEVQINTPLRPSAARPLDIDGIFEIKAHFKHLPAVTVYDRNRILCAPLDESATIRRHGNYKV